MADAATATGMCFNPTLVRLRLEVFERKIEDNKTVSIPRWFD